MTEQTQCIESSDMVTYEAHNEHVRPAIRVLTLLRHGRFQKLLDDCLAFLVYLILLVIVAFARRRARQVNADKCV